MNSYKVVCGCAQCGKLVLLFSRGTSSGAVHGADCQWVKNNRQADVAPVEQAW